VIHFGGSNLSISGVFEQVLCRHFDREIWEVLAKEK